MNIEPTNETDVVCKDLIGEAYVDAHIQLPEGTIEGDTLAALWADVQAALKMDMSTTVDEDNKAMDILGEVFEKACRTADEEGRFDYSSEYVDYKKLWERICAVIGVEV